MWRRGINQTTRKPVGVGALDDPLQPQQKRATDGRPYCVHTALASSRSRLIWTMYLCLPPFSISLDSFFILCYNTVKHTKETAMTPKTPISREALERSYKNSRGNLLLVVIFTVINAIMAFAGSSSYFLFSAYLPYYSVIFGLALTGRLDVDLDFQLDEKYLVYFIGFAVLVLGLYLLFWLFSKKHYGWLIPSLVFFALDTLFLLRDSFGSGFDFSMLMDVVFHAWVLLSLVLGIMNGVKLKKLDAAEAAAAPIETTAEDKTEEKNDDGVFKG